jgi:hypothetical protein
MSGQEILPSTMTTPRRFLLYALAALLVVGLISYWVWSLGEEQRAIRDMPITERRAFYHRTLQNLTSLCMGSEAAQLVIFCREEAERILLFPECDHQCQDLAMRKLHQRVR